MICLVLLSVIFLVVIAGRYLCAKILGIPNLLARDRPGRYGPDVDVPQNTTEGKDCDNLRVLASKGASATLRPLLLDGFGPG